MDHISPSHKRTVHRRRVNVITRRGSIVVRPGDNTSFPRLIVAYEQLVFVKCDL